MNHLYHFGPYTLDPRRRRLSRQGSAVSLTPKAFDLLLFFAQNPNRVITKDELLKAVWADSFVEEGNLTQNVFLLRRALGQKSEDSGLIVTIPRKGYQFAGDVSIVSQPALSAEVPASQTAAAVSPGHVAITIETERESEAVETSSSQMLTSLVRRSATRSRPVLALLFTVATLILVLAGYLSWNHFRAKPTPPPGIMLAVLPLQNLTGDPEQEYFADGLTEELIAQLGRLQPEQLGVIARTSVMGYKHTDKRLDQIGR